MKGMVVFGLLLLAGALFAETDSADPVVNKPCRSGFTKFGEVWIAGSWSPICIPSQAPGIQTEKPILLNPTPKPE